MRPLPLVLVLPLLLACPAERVTKETGDQTVPLAGKALPLSRIFADPPLAGTSPRAVQLSPDGARLTFLKPSEDDAEVLDLWARDLKTGEEQALVTTKQLVGDREIELSEEERMANERKRVRHTGITSYQFCGESGERLLFPLDSELYLVVLDARGHRVQKLTDDKRAKLDPQCSKSGKLVVFVHESDLYLIRDPVKGGKAQRLTTRTSDTLHNGVAEFIAQEEMGRYTGFWLSPDELWLAYLQVDESKVGVKKRPFIHVDKTELYEQRYPAAGEDNADVRLMLLALAPSLKPVAQRFSSDGGYIPRVGWTPDNQLWVQWQSRDQKTLQILRGAPHAQKAVAFEQILEEKDDAWVELHDDLLFLEKMPAFLWRSERDGVSRLWLIPSEGAPRVLTAGDNPVSALLGVDEESGRVWFTAATDRGRQHHLFSTTLRGDDAQQLTKVPGWHEVKYGKRALVDTRSRVLVPPSVHLLDKDGAALAVLDENPGTELLGYALPAHEFLDAKASDGTVLNALAFAPQGVTGKGPVITYVYGGPTGQVVADRWAGLQPMITHWTQRGFGVVLVDNRGMSSRDRAFSRAHYRQIGVVELEDIHAFVRELSVPWVDPARVGIFGWSYGGYVASRSILDEKTPFRAAAAVAPVTDWTLYDTHYTERYLGTPKDDAAAYAQADVVSHANSLGDRRLLLVHGMADDNVLFQNTLTLMQALQNEGAIFELMVYPGKAHGLRGRETQEHVFSTITEFFLRSL